MTKRVKEAARGLAEILQEKEGVLHFHTRDGHYVIDYRISDHDKAIIIQALQYWSQQ